jgi:hypothetical protein
VSEADVQRVGIPLAKALEMDLADVTQMEKIKALVKTLEKLGPLKKVDHKDERRKIVKRYQLDGEEFEALWEATEFGIYIYPAPFGVA